MYSIILYVSKVFRYWNVSTVIVCRYLYVLPMRGVVCVRTLATAARNEFRSRSRLSKRSRSWLTSCWFCHGK